MVSIVVNSDDDDLAERMAKAFGDQAEELAGLPAAEETPVDVWISDPVQVVR